MNSFYVSMEACISKVMGSLLINVESSCHIDCMNCNCINIFIHCTR